MSYGIELVGKIVTGIFVNRDEMGYVERSQILQKRAAERLEKRYIRGSGPRGEVGN